MLSSSIGAPPNRRYQGGLTLLEVMVAVVIFSIGLIGTGALLTSAIRGNHSSLQRTTALSLATSIEARMARNSPATWQGLYNGTYTGSGSGQECDTSACTDAQLAAADVALWGQQISDALPGGTGTIQCQNGGWVLPAGAIGKPPFGGICQITITWTELGDEGSANPTTAQTFLHVAQP